MSTLHIELSEYDAMRNRNKKLEERESSSWRKNLKAVRMAPELSSER